MIDIDKVDEMYNNHRILKRKGYYKYHNGKRVWIPPKYRKIQAPFDELKKEQKRILREELNHIKVSNCAYGFVNNKSIHDNAKAHLGAKWILEIDLKDFFDTITEEMVYKALVNNHVPEEKAKYITRICTRYGKTPQGAPTSPYLSNIVCKPMDRKIKKVCKEFDCKYTRYADDITISTKKDNGYEILQKIKPKIISIINKHGFKINGNKMHTVGKHRRQSVTGIVINEKLNVSNKDIKNFRAKLHNILMNIKDGNLHTLEELEQKYESINSLYGYANFIYSVNPKKCKKYLDQVKEIRAKLIRSETHGEMVSRS